MWAVHIKPVETALQHHHITTLIYHNVPVLSSLRSIQVKPHMFLMRVCIRRYMLISQWVEGTIWHRPVTVFALKSEKFLSSAPLLPGHGRNTAASDHSRGRWSWQGESSIEAVVLQWRSDGQHPSVCGNCSLLFLWVAFPAVAPIEGGGRVLSPPSPPVSPSSPPMGSRKNWQLGWSFRLLWWTRRRRGLGRDKLLEQEKQAAKEENQTTQLHRLLALHVILDQLRVQINGDITTLP